LITRIIFGEECRQQSTSFTESPSFPCFLVSLRPKYLPQHPILDDSQPMFLPQYDRPSFTPIQNKRHNYSSMCLNFHLFG
jgi:hypothetical protein